MGFKDGTANIKAEDTATMNTHVWVQPGDGPDWMAGGSYLVSRRIRMLIEPWGSTPLTEQERVIGRRKGIGAPLGKHNEFDPLDLTTTDPSGQPLLDPNAHVRIAHSSHNNGAVLHDYTLATHHPDMENGPSRNSDTRHAPGCDVRQRARCGET